MSPRPFRCKVVCYDRPAAPGPKLDTFIEVARVPHEGEYIELPDARHYRVWRVSWTSRERSDWSENLGRRVPVEMTPILEVTEV